MHLHKLHQQRKKSGIRNNNFLLLWNGSFHDLTNRVLNEIMYVFQTSTQRSWHCSSGGTCIQWDSSTWGGPYTDSCSRNPDSCCTQRLYWQYHHWCGVHSAWGLVQNLSFGSCKSSEKWKFEGIIHGADFVITSVLTNDVLFLLNDLW